jgi:hypothetical protein
LLKGKARGGETAQRTYVREQFSTTSNAAIGQEMKFLEPVLVEATD